MHVSLFWGGLDGLKKKMDRSRRLKHMRREKFATNEEESRRSGQERKKVHEAGPEQKEGKK